MNRFSRWCWVTLGVWLLFWAGASLTRAQESARPEVRALWVDAFRDGAKTPEQIDQLIQDSLRGNINTLIVQVRRRGDAYYNESIEPRTEDPVLPAGFDALQYLIDKAHANGIEVHAWLNTLVAWNSSVPPQSPSHVWNLHGPQATGKADWVSYYRTYDKTAQAWSDKLNSSFYLDPGNPDALDYTADVYINIVKHYKVDGIHLDYSRYAGRGWGYNPTSVARFDARYGLTGTPAPDDPRWDDWRREQTAALMRKIYLKAIALRPDLKVSSAVITWGDGPAGEDGWEKSRAYNEVFQDWRAWLEEGILDLAMPMNYFNEWDDKQKLWYDHWIEWEKDHQYGRQIVVGPGAFSLYPEESLDQIRRAQKPSSKGNQAFGVALFSYGASSLYSNNDFTWSSAAKVLPRQPYGYLPQTNGWLYHLLSHEGGYSEPVSNTFVPTQPVFATPAGFPDMPWKSHPLTGYLMGTATFSAGENIDHRKVIIESIQGEQKIRREVYTDGSGWYGLTGLLPGEYRVTLETDQPGASSGRTVTVQAGRVAEVSLP